MNMENEQRAARLDYVFHLEKAIESGEFELFYQPIIHTISGSLCGFEALVRWHHPIFGFLNPGQFIHSLEDTKQIYHLDIHVVEQVCRWYARERAADRPVVPVSVNLSRIDFGEVDIFDEVNELTDRYKMPHHMLNIEITESVFGNDHDHITETIQRFRSAGYQVWMDDFGSGYSSLNTLKDYEIDELKIDMGFLSDMSPRSKRIITSVISMAKEINLITLVEGVETEEQVEFLKKIGCDRMQGFYFARPMHYEGLLATLREKNIRFESDEDRKYYHKINRINLLSPSPFTLPGEGKETHSGGIPLAILEQDEGRYSFIYRNDEFRNLLKTIGACGAEDAMQKLTHFGILTQAEIRSFLAETISHGSKELVFATNGDLCSAKARLISATAGRRAVLLSISNITESMNISHEQLMDQSLKNIYSLYLRVSILRPEKNELVTIFSQDHHNVPKDTVLDLKKLTQDYAAQWIPEEDRQAYLNFVNPATLEERILHSRRGFINTKIQTQDKDGEYSKKMYLAVAAGNHEVLLLVRYANL